MFVHWGMHSVLGRGEQIMYRDLIPLAEFEALADDFRPAPDWASRLAQGTADAGLKYVVLTTRHHDGYCLFDTATHDFHAARTGPGRDLVAEYVEALREAGLKVGFYFSLLTWRWPAYWSPRRHPEDLPRIVDEAHAQVRELMTSTARSISSGTTARRFLAPPGTGCGAALPSSRMRRISGERRS